MHIYGRWRNQENIDELYSLSQIDLDHIIMRGTFNNQKFFPTMNENNFETHKTHAITINPLLFKILNHIDYSYILYQYSSHLNK